LARALRDRAHARLRTLAPHGLHALEIGCGTGEDAVMLAQHGVHVTATDPSAEMLRCTREKAAAHGVPLTTFALDASALPADSLTHPFDLVYSNFGALNCLDSAARSRLAAWLATRTRENSTLALCIMGSRCAWEWFWHAAHGDFVTASRRAALSTAFHTASGSITITYPAPSQIAREFAPHFRVTRCVPFGLIIPPTAMYAALERRPRLMRALIAWDAATEWMSVCANYADHYWIELRRS
jgi:SAM-dependent methyltransferase